jgi:mRNA-degrading endonuclease RelE of RelBE toxin-antitoxin system
VFTIVIEKRAREFLKKIPRKSRRIIVDKIHELVHDPFPGGDTEKPDHPHPPAVYRLHVSRSFTVFSLIEEEELVKIMTMKKGTQEILVPEEIG